MRYAIITEQWLQDGTTLYKGDKDEIVAWLMQQTDVSKYEILPDGSVVRLTVGEFLSNIINVVPKFYQMDPETEDLLSNGDRLANGMKVLLGDPADRARPEETGEDWARDRALERNRWCVITNLKLVGNNVSFIGVYDDGTKRRRSANRSRDTWLVKLDSLPKSRAEDTKLYKDVYEIVKGALDANEEEQGLYSSRIAKTATKKILGSLG